MKVDYIIQLIFILVSTFLGYSFFYPSGTGAAYIGGGIGLVFGVSLVMFSFSIKKINIRRLCWGAYLE